MSSPPTDPGLTQGAPGKPNPPADTRRTPGSLGTIAGWHALVVLGFVVWVLTWPETVSAGGAWHLTLSRWLLAALLALAAAPGLALSFGIACGLSFLPILRRRSGPVRGTIAALAGIALVVAGVAGYALISRAGWI